MNLLKLTPATKLINGKQSACYGVYCGKELLHTVSIFSYDKTLEMINKANAVMEMQSRMLVDRAKRMAAGRRALELCEKLTVSRSRLTKKTFIAANKAANLGN